MQPRGEEEAPKPGVGSGSGAMRFLLVYLVMAAAALGWLAGVSMGGSCEIGGLYSPLEYWRVLSMLSYSPWSFTSPELREAIFEAKKEIASVGLMGVAAAGAWYVGGPVAVQGVIAHMGSAVGARAGAKLAHVAQNLELDEDSEAGHARRRPRRRPRRQVLDSSNQATDSSSQALVVLK